MKRIILLLLIVMAVCRANAQPITDSASERTRINTDIVTNGTRSITGAMLNRILQGYLNFWPKYSIDSLRRVGDSVWYRKDKIWRFAYKDSVGAGGGSGIIVGTTTVTGGSNGNVLYNDAGVVGEYITSGSGAIVRTTSPSIGTSIITANPSFDVFNTVASTVNAFGAAGTMNIGGTPTTGLTHSYSANVTATGNTKTVNIATGGASGSTTALNIGSATSGATNNIKLSITPASDATGDIFYRNSSGFLTRLPVGSNGDVLTLASGLPSWAAPAGGGGWGTTGTVATLTGNASLNLAGNTFTIAGVNWNANGDETVTDRIKIYMYSSDIRGGWHPSQGGFMVSPGWGYNFTNAQNFNAIDASFQRSAASVIKAFNGGLSATGYAAVESLYHRFGSGSPEGVVTAPIGCLYSRTDGGAGTSLYVKESGAGNTGWVAK